jgi:hypothetical protein
MHGSRLAVLCASALLITCATVYRPPIEGGTANAVVYGGQMACTNSGQIWSATGGQKCDVDVEFTGSANCRAEVRLDGNQATDENSNKTATAKTSKVNANRIVFGCVGTGSDHCSYTIKDIKCSGGGDNRTPKVDTTVTKKTPVGCGASSQSIFAAPGSKKCNVTVEYSSTGNCIANIDGQTSAVSSPGDRPVVTVVGTQSLTGTCNASPDTNGSCNFDVLQAECY